MPVQLAHAARDEAHVDAGQRRRDRQIPHGNLPGPSAVVQLHVRIRKRELHVGQQTGVRGGRHEHIRIFQIPQHVAGSEVGTACAVLADRLGHFNGTGLSAGDVFHRRQLLHDTAGLPSCFICMNAGLGRMCGPECPMARFKFRIRRPSPQWRKVQILHFPFFAFLLCSGCS
ncbi:hypothetical protein SAMN05216312_107278 [Cohnella sp. OV330]|nr:hypothetical protein SAMN05216312_107278 [Cohnella sp. OV330]